MILPTLCALFATLSTAAHLTVQIPASGPLTNPSTLAPSTHATLHAAGPPLSAPLNTFNQFIFPSVPAGSYLLEIHNREYAFEALRVDVATSAEGREYVGSWTTFRGREWGNKGEQRGSGEAVVKGEEAKVFLQVLAEGGREYYASRQGFSVMSMFSNPMILIAIFSLGLIVGMPYLLENMDPELREEFDAMQKNKGPVTNPAAALQNFDLAGWMAGTSSAPADEPVAAIEEKKSGGGSKRRG